MNTAKEYVQAMADTSPVHEFVADHGQVLQSETEQVSIAEYNITLAEDITENEKSLIGRALQAIQPETQKCYANALRMWEYNHRFDYVEGFATLSNQTDSGYGHAWCLLDGAKIVDPTPVLSYLPRFNDYYGVPITSEQVLKRYTGDNFSHAGIIGNHSNQYEFLRERGYAYADAEES